MRYVYMHYSNFSLDDPQLVKHCLPNKERFRKEVAHHLSFSDIAYNYLKELLLEIEIDIEDIFLNWDAL